MAKCSICEDRDDVVNLLEKHHWLGRKLSDICIWLCKNCHSVVTHYQNKLLTKVRKSRKNRHMTIFAVASIGGLLVVIGKKLLWLADRLAREEMEK